MLNLFFWVLIGNMIALAGMQLLFVTYYRKILRDSNLQEADFADPNTTNLTSTLAPRVAIVLCLRGPDPTLNECLTSLLKQRYPNFDLHLIVDSDEDPVIPIATLALQTIDSTIDVHWHTVANPGSNCSLKCSALVTAVTFLESKDPKPDIIAFVDADALVDLDWLNRLVAPLSNSFNGNSSRVASNSTVAVGATTGNRWFEPTDNNLGSQFRAAWNAAALPQMQIYQVAWGGSLAMKLETIQKCDLLSRWSQAFCEDTMLADVLRDHGLSIQRVPELIVVNQESTTLLPALGWIERQLLTVRLHHRAWFFILLHALMGGFCFFAPLAFVMTTFIENQTFAIWAALAWCVQLCLNIGILEFIRQLNVSVIRESALKPTNSNGIFSKVVVAITLQAIYPFLAIGVAFRRQVSWRGIDYRIGGGGEIEMLNYVPYSEIIQQDQHSIR